MNGGFAWMAQQLMLVSPEPAPAPAPRFNPHPPGVPWPGSATDAVLQVLRAQPGFRFNRRQLIAMTGHTEKAVDWALIYLRRRDLIEVCPDASRNPRYMRYRVKREA